MKLVDNDFYASSMCPADPERDTGDAIMGKTVRSLHHTSAGRPKQINITRE